MMNECPPFQMMPPQVMPIYGPQLPTNAFPISGPPPPIYPLPPTHFGFPPIAWSPVHHYPPLSPSPVYNHPEDCLDNYNVPHDSTFNNNNNNNVVPQNVSQSSESIPEPAQPQHPYRHAYNRYVANKFDTRHEEFRKYLEEMGILSIFTNILLEMYQDPLRPSDPLEYIRNKLNCSRPETIELSNLRFWCDQYQTKAMRLEKELKNVIERLRKHEPYNTDDSLFKVISAENDCKSCVKDATKQECKMVIDKKKC